MLYALKAFFFKAHISDCSALHFWEHGRDETTPALVDVVQGTGGRTQAPDYGNLEEKAQRLEHCYI